MKIVTQITICSIILVGSAFAAGNLADGVVNRTTIHDQKQILDILRQSTQPLKGDVAYDKEIKKQMLSIKGKKIHASARLEEIYSTSADEVVLAFVAYSSEMTPVHLADAGEDGKVRASLGEVWVKKGDSPAIRISPIQLHSRHPRVSPDGRYVAFTGARQIANGMRGRESVFLIKLPVDDREQPIVVATAEHIDGTARALWWVNPNTLLLFVAENQDGARSRLEKVTLAE